MSDLGLLETRMNHREYKNGMKAGFCLQILQEWLHPFTDGQMRCFHENLLRQNLQLRNRCETSCRPRKNELSRPCKPCSEWQREILRHRRQPDATVNWDNCSPSSWRQEPWEVAKAYMPRGLRTMKRAHQCDASGLLNLINHCDQFGTIDSSVVRQVIQYRNELMHSCQFQVKDEWMTRYRTSLRNLLQQFSGNSHMEKVQQEIEQVLAVDFSISISGFGIALAADEHALQLVGQCGFGLDVTDIRRMTGDYPVCQWEAELLHEMLQELLNDEESQDTEKLTRTRGFLQANSDLSEIFCAELQTISSLCEGKERK